MTHVIMPSVEGRPSLRELPREPPRWRRFLGLALLLVPSSVLAGDVYYPEYKRDPVPPVVLVEDVVIEDDGRAPACSPANDHCDDPDGPGAPPASVAVAPPSRRGGRGWIASRGDEARISP